jgi:hypothetical protein
MTERLARAKVYRNVELRQQWLGVEPLDAVSLGALAWLLMLVNRSGLSWNLLALALAYGGLRVAKRGKPKGYTTTLLRYYLRRPFFSAAAPDRRLSGSPFPEATHPVRNPYPRSPS